VLLYTLLEVLRVVAISISCFMPSTADNILKQLGVEKATEKMREGSPINKANPLFPRIETKSVQFPR